MGKYMELAKVMIKRNINILCHQQIKWTSDKTKPIGEWGHKLWFRCRDRNGNWIGIGIVLHCQLVDEIVDVRRMGYRTFPITLILGDEAINIISVYAPQICLDVASKQ